MCGHPEGDIIEGDFNLKSVGFGSGTGYGIGFTELFREPTTRETIYNALYKRLVMDYGEPAINAKGELVFRSAEEIKLSPEDKTVAFRTLDQKTKRGTIGLITKLQALNE